ncbi:MAG: helix-turn-helix domain-containing protein [Nanoarchaeota archaeon]
MNLAYELEYLGFTPNEVKVYLTLLRLGMAKAGKIAQECRLERTSTYHALQRLVQVGIVSTILESSRKIFAAAPAESIVSIFKEKENRAELLIPLLKEIKQGEREKETILKFRGYGGIKTVMNDILKSSKEGEEYLVMGMEGQLSERLPTYAEIFVARKDEKKLRSRVLVRKTGQKKMSKYTRVRYVSQETVSPLNVNIYGNKVALLIWSETPEAVIIDNAQAAQAFRAYFELMWKHAKH